jgi:hypothetical protein
LLVVHPAEFRSDYMFFYLIHVCEAWLEHAGMYFMCDLRKKRKEEANTL